MIVSLENLANNMNINLNYILETFAENPLSAVTNFLLFLFVITIFKIITNKLQKYFEKKRKESYSFLKQYFVKRGQKTRELRDELIKKLKSDKDVLITFYFYENRIRAKYFMYLVVSLMSFLAVFIFSVPVLSKMVDMGNYLPIIYVSMIFYAIGAVNALFSLYYHFYLKRIKLILKEVSINPQDYIKL